MMDKTPKPGTRRRSLYDLLVSRPGEWIDFDPKTLGYKSPSSRTLVTDMGALRDIYDLDIRTAGAGRPGLCRWRYVPR
jgi:hypothetical protein